MIKKDIEKAQKKTPKWNENYHFGGYARVEKDSIPFDSAIRYQQMLLFEKTIKDSQSFQSTKD